MTTVFDPLRMSAVSLDVMAVNRDSAQGVARRQQARLALLLDAALAGSRLYRQLLAARTTARTPLQNLPVVTRGQLMERFDDWVTDPCLTLDALRAFTADPSRIAQPWQGRYMVWESSGTSGQPGIFVQDAQAMAVYDALEALRRCAPRPLARWLDPLSLAERIAFVGATSGHFASYVSVQRLRALNPWLAGNTRSFSIQVPTPELVAALNDFAPTVLATYPTAAALLADEAGSGALRIAPREVWTGGETLSPTVRAHIAQGLDCPVRNSYGASEFFTMGWECAHGHMHLNADWVILEPVDEHQRPVPPGQPSCSVLLTNLANTVQPLIRYDLGEGDHPLLGRRMPDLDLVTADGPVRVYALLHDARPVLLNLGEPGGLDITPWADRVQLFDADYDGAWDNDRVVTSFNDHFGVFSIFGDGGLWL